MNALPARTISQQARRLLALLLGLGFILGVGAARIAQQTPASELAGHPHVTAVSADHQPAPGNEVQVDGFSDLGAALSPTGAEPSPVASEARALWRTAPGRGPRGHPSKIDRPPIAG